MHPEIVASRSGRDNATDINNLARRLVREHSFRSPRTANLVCERAHPAARRGYRSRRAIARGTVGAIASGRSNPTGSPAVARRC